MTQKSKEQLGNFMLKLLTISKEEREQVGDFYTIIQAALLGNPHDYGYDAAELLAFILPPGKSPMYNGGYCPPCGEKMIAILEELFDFSLASNTASDYNDVNIVRRLDRKSVKMCLKVGFDFGNKEYRKRVEQYKYDLNKKATEKLAALEKGEWNTPSAILLARLLGKTPNEGATNEQD